MIAPTALHRKGNHHLIVAWNDGRQSEYETYRLRLSCPCAACVNEWNGEKILKADSISKDVHPIRLFSVGRYAVGVQWSDGHSTGIFSYDYLRRLDDRETTQKPIN